jgi:hypothetical protein
MNYAILTNLNQILIMSKFYLSKTQKKLHIWKVHELLINLDVKFVKIGFQKVLK